MLRSTSDTAVTRSPPAAARRAVSGLFVLNAIAYANVVPRLPAIKSELDLSNAAFGAAIAAMAVGALSAGLLAGRLIARFGSAAVAVAAGVVLGLATPLFAAASTWVTLGVTFAVVGAADSVMDISMNAQALVVEGEYGRSIINSVHGLWSVGAVVGGGAGAVCAGAGVALWVHFTVTGAVIGAMALVLRAFLLPEGPPVPAASPSGRASARGAAPRAALAVLGLIVIAGAMVEDAPASWGAVLLRDELTASTAVAGSVYLTFQTTMTIGRAVADRVVDRVGAARVLRGSSLVAAAGMGLALASREPAIVIVGFAVAGFGAAPVFPLAFGAGGRLPGVAAGQGVAMVGTLARIGFLISPPVVGIVGDAASLRVGLLVAPAAAFTVAALAAAVRRR